MDLLYELETLCSDECVYILDKKNRFFYIDFVDLITDSLNLNKYENEPNDNLSDSEDSDVYITEY